MTLSVVGQSMSVLKDLDEIDRTAVDKFREYLRIPSVHPDVDYDPCVTFLKEYGKELGLPVDVFYPHPKKPAVIFTWLGKEPGLSTILLNGHMDVVPVFEDKWKHPPFAAEIEDGKIYARGTQDMKSLSIQYLEAIRRLKAKGVVPKRTVHVSFVADEELGTLGFREFVKTDDFRKMNVGFALDEADPSPEDSYIVYYAEKSCWHFIVHCPGQPGHGSMVPKITAGEKARVIIERFSDYRRSELRKTIDDPSVKVWDITSVNLTIMKGGLQTNVIPEEFCLTYDIRIAPTVDVKEFEKMIEGWCREAGKDVWIEYEEKENQRPITSLKNNPYWDAMERVAKDFKVRLDVQVGMGASDSRYIREINIPALSILALRNTPNLTHSHNEYVSVDSFLDGVRFMQQLIPALADA